MTDVAMDVAKYLNAKNDPADWWAEMKMRADGDDNNLYVHDMPPSPDFAVAVRIYPGASPVETFSNPVQVRKPRVQIEVRHEFSNTALDRSGDILKYLTQVKDQVINGTKYQRISPVGEPIEIGPDSSGRQRVMVNFETAYYDTI